MPFLHIGEIKVSFIADEGRHGINGTQYLDGKHVPADVCQDAEEDDPSPDPPNNNV